MNNQSKDMTNALKSPSISFQKSQEPSLNERIKKLNSPQKSPKNKKQEISDNEIKIIEEAKLETPPVKIIIPEEISKPMSIKQDDIV